MARITNRQIADHVARLAPFQANSTRGEWTDYATPLGYLPEPFYSAYEATVRAERERGALVYVVHSYATPVAWFTRDGGWVVPPVKYSRTTSRVQTYVRTGAGEYVEALPVSV